MSLEAITSCLKNDRSFMQAETQSAVLCGVLRHLHEVTSRLAIIFS
ncbi:hypothetical protein E2C01_062430 [Portunus trituberculatus]|uniref:Uncharacterized protein n=1 Tax=Portunus trituberculatus TaxID=210409 RepID=A0A5B7HB29_PORTR|nr:hypothetical protein [Portunus trituberculatus]